LVRDQDGPRVLLVEDDRRSHQLLRQILVQAGCDVISAMTQAGGLAGVRDDLDCLLLDLRLPDGDGEAILRKVRSEGMAMRVAVMTAETDPERLRAVAALEPEVVLRKPLDLGQLLRWIEPPEESSWGLSELAGAAC
jgi:DNA-binding response OmpR family regulator